MVPRLRSPWPTVNRTKSMAIKGRDLWRGQTIGLLGGSFNPAHDGHRHISLFALNALELDHVWWLVSPGNPLKDQKDYAPLNKRISWAKATANHPRLHVMAPEQALGTRYTIDTILALKKQLPETHFVWIMGADNLQQFSKWKHWQVILDNLSIAIFDRPGYSISALNSSFARRFRAKRLNQRRAKMLKKNGSKGWSFMTCPRHPASASAIRNRS